MIHSLVIRPKNICSTNCFYNKIQLIKPYAAWNGNTRNNVNDIIKHALPNNDNNYRLYNDNDIDAVRMYIKIKYSGETADRLIKQCMKKLYICFKNEKGGKFVLQYETTKFFYQHKRQNSITKPVVGSL